MEPAYRLLETMAVRILKSPTDARGGNQRYVMKAAVLLQRGEGRDTT
jgi:hypothetical protein